MPMPNFDVQVVHDAWQTKDDDPLGDPLSMTRRVVGAINSHLEGALGEREITVRFAADEEVQALNHQFRQKDAATNVLSFPATSVPGLGDDASGDLPLGDIILAYETVAKEAAAQGKTFSDHSVHLILHGILHLLGYDHATDEEAAKMEALEREILTSLNIADPYIDHSEAAHVS